MMPVLQTGQVILEAVRNALNLHANRLRRPDIAEQVWKQYLTSAERIRAGTDLEAAFMADHSRTIGIWARAKGVSEARAIVELAHHFGLPIGETEWLLREIGEPATPTVIVPAPDHPVWDRDRGELRLRENIIRTITNRSTGAELLLILDVFQELSWPFRIDDPLPGGPDPDRLRDRVRNLNKKLTEIEFSRDGSGQGITWSFLPPRKA